MNVYWGGTEDIDFAAYAGAFATSYYDSAWSRTALGLSVGSTTWPIASFYSNLGSFGNLSSFWFHCSLSDEGSNATTANGIWLAFADSGGVGRILVRGTGTAGQVKISTRNAAGTITDLSGAISASGALPNVTTPPMKVDLFVNYAVSGQIQLYINGVLAADTGAGVNVTTDSATSLSFFYLSSPSTSGAHWDYSQVFVADSDTRGAGLWLVNSNTAGNAQTWTGTATNVNKAAINDGTFISAASTGLIEEFKSGGIALPTGTFAVAAVIMTSRAEGGSGGGPTRVEYVTRVGSTDFVGGTWTPPVGSFANDTQNYKQATNPGTSAAWTTADLTATTFNYGVESVA